MLKIDKVIQATAENLALAIRGSNENDREIFMELANDLANSYEEIDPSFNRAVFLNIVDPD